MAAVAKEGFRRSFGTVLNLEGVSTNMPTIVKTLSGTGKSLIRKAGFQTTVKTFRSKRDAEEWAPCNEDEMVRWRYFWRGPSERMTFEKATAR